MTQKDILDVVVAEAAIPVVHGAAEDFDFLVGNWNVRMRRRRRILSGSDEWYDVAATSDTRKIVGGMGIIDDFHMLAQTGDIAAMTLRLFDPAARQWSIYWATSPSGVLQTPVLGGFEHGDGYFYGLDTYDGKPILVRFLWRRGATPQWEQAFSADGQRTWETNWTMDFDCTGPR